MENNNYITQKQFKTIYGLTIKAYGQKPNQDCCEMWKELNVAEASNAIKFLLTEIKLNDEYALEAQ